MFISVRAARGYLFLGWSWLLGLVMPIKGLGPTLRLQLRIGIMGNFLDSMERWYFFFSLTNIVRNSFDIIASVIKIQKMCRDTFETVLLILWGDWIRPLEDIPNTTTEYWLVTKVSGVPCLRAETDPKYQLWHPNP